MRFSASTTRTPSGSLAGKLAGPVAVTLPQLTQWKFKVGAPEIAPGFNDSKWIRADRTHSNNPFLKAGQPVLDMGKVFSNPVISPSRVPPRVLDPVLSAIARMTGLQPEANAFPALLCSDFSIIKQVVAGSNAIMASTLSRLLPCALPLISRSAICGPS